MDEHYLHTAIRFFCVEFRTLFISLIFVFISLGGDRGLLVGVMQDQCMILPGSDVKSLMTMSMTWKFCLRLWTQRIEHTTIQMWIWSHSPIMHTRFEPAPGQGKNNRYFQPIRIFLEANLKILFLVEQLFIWFFNFLFNIFLKALNDFFRSVESSWVQTETPQGPPTGMNSPTVTQSADKDPTSLIVTWQLPDEINGQLQSFRLYRNDTPMFSFPPDQFSFVDDQLQVHFPSLWFNKYHYISVRYWNNSIFLHYKVRICRCLIRWLILRLNFNFVYLLKFSVYS